MQSGRYEPSRPWLFMGLGNPGPKYAGNRHNVGQLVVGRLAAETRATWKTVRGAPGTACAEIRLRLGAAGGPGPRVVLGRSTGYMNTSGGPTSSLRKYFDVPLDQVVVIHDELDLPFGALRLKRGGGEGGHNGLRDISRALGSKDYCRLRFGVGRPPGRMDPADYVLRDFASAERSEVPLLVTQCSDALEDLTLRGLSQAQQRLHAPEGS